MTLTISVEKEHASLLETITHSLSVHITMPRMSAQFYNGDFSLGFYERVLEIPATDNTVIAVMMEVIKYKNNLQDPSCLCYTLEVGGCD